MAEDQIYLDTSVGGTASINEQGKLIIRAYEDERGNKLGQVILDAHETWLLLEWLSSHREMLYQLTHQGQEPRLPD